MNVGEWSLKRARSWPERAFLKQGELGLTNREFNDRVNRAARVLLARGVQKGDRVATVMVNCSAFLELYFACAKIGAVIVPINHHLAVPELAQTLDDCGPRVVMFSPGFTPAVDELRAGGGRVDWLQHAGEAQAAATGLDDPADPRATAEPEVRWDVGLDDPLLIMFTSGTTGSLKGAVLSHNNFLFGAIQNLLFGVNAGFKSLVVAPLFHIGALVASATPVIYAGGSLVIRDFDNPSEIIRLILREKINYMFAVPAMFKMMSKAPGWEEADFSHVHFFIAGGAPMPVPLIQQYQEEKGVRFVQGYGMTETLRISSLDPDDARRKVGSIGKELFHTSVRIVDDDGVEVPRRGDRRDRRQGARGVQPLLEQPRGDRGGHPRRLVPHRRPRPARRGRLHLHRRPQERHDHLRRQKRLRRRGGAGDRGPGRGVRGGRRGNGRRGARRGAGRVRGAEDARRADGRGRGGGPQEPARRLQDSQEDRAGGRAAADRQRQGREERTQAAAHP